MQTSLLQPRCAGRLAAAGKGQAAETLRQINLRFDTALSNMSHGMLMCGCRRAASWWSTGGSATSMASIPTAIRAGRRISRRGAAERRGRQPSGPHASTSVLAEHRRHHAVAPADHRDVQHHRRRPDDRDLLRADAGRRLDRDARRHHRTVQIGGADRIPGAARCADPAAQSRGVPGTAPAGVGAGRTRPKGSRCCASISTSSRWSTTRSAIRSATNCCARWHCRLRDTVREGDIVARLGGDEFADHPSSARRGNRRCHGAGPPHRRAIGAPYELDGNQVVDRRQHRHRAGAAATARIRRSC